MTEYRAPSLNAYFLTKGETKELGFHKHIELIEAAVKPGSGFDKSSATTPHAKIISSLLREDNAYTLAKMVERGFSLDNFYIQKFSNNTSSNHALYLSIEHKAYRIFDFLLTQTLQPLYINAVDSEYTAGSPLLYAAYGALRHSKKTV